MGQRRQIQLSFHGALVLLIGMIFGIPYALAIVGTWGEETVRAWRVAHTGVAAVGVTLIAVAGILSHLALRERLASLLVWSLLVSGYGFAIGLVLVAAAGVRGLQASGSLLNLIAFSVDGVAVLAAFLGVGLVIYGAFAALQQK